MKLITRFNQFILESLIEDDETIRNYRDWKLGETRKIDDVYRNLPESAADPTPGYYTLEIIPISKTDLYNDFTRVGSGAKSGKGTVPALSREYWAHDDYDGYQTEQLDMIKQGWDTPKRLPIIVEESNGVYEVIDGHHRLTIAKELGKKSILALVRKDHEKSEILTHEYYLDDFYSMDGMDYYSESQALDKIQKVIDYVTNIKYPIKVYRGINTKNPKENYEGGSWSTDVRVSEGFGNKIYVGMIPSQSVIDVEQTIRTRVMNPYEFEIYVPNFDDVEIIDTYEK